MTIPGNVMSTDRVPTKVEDLAPLLAADPDGVRARLRQQEGAHRAGRLLVAAQRRLDAAAKPAPTKPAAAAARKPGGRSRVGEPFAHGRARDGSLRSRGTTIALGEGVVERVDALAEKRTLANKAKGGPAVSRNEIVRAAIRELLANPPEAEDVSFDALRGHTGERFVYIPEVGQDARLEELTEEVLKAVGRGGLQRQKIHLIRYAVGRYLAKHRRR